MIKKIIKLLLISMIFLAGCSFSHVNNPTKFNKDDVLISFKNYNIKLYKYLTMGPFITFDIISDKPLENNIQLSIDIKTPYKLFIEKNNIDEMPYYVFENYQNIDWKRMYDLYLKSIPNSNSDINLKAAEEFSKYQNLYYKAYEKFKQENLYKNCYYYTGTITFDMSNSDISKNEVFKDIILKINNKDYNFNIGNVELDYTTKLDLNDSNLTSKTPEVSDKKLSPSSQGTIIINDASFTCAQDLQIDGFRILNPNIDMKEVSLTIEENGSSMDEKFTNSQNISVKKGTTITPKIIVSDKNFDGKLLYSTIIYLIVDYEADGKKYSTNFEAMYRTRPDFYELIAEEHDHVNFLPSYDNYFNLIKEE